MSKRILVVEDQEDNRRILRDMLGNAGYELIEAESGEEALTAVEAQRPDLILMDIQLPVMDGYEATRRIRSNPDMKAVPIIAMTSYALAGDEAKASGCGLQCLRHQALQSPRVARESAGILGITGGRVKSPGSKRAVKLERATSATGPTMTRPQSDLAQWVRVRREYWASSATRWPVRANIKPNWFYLSLKSQPRARTARRSTDPALRFGLHHGPKHSASPLMSRERPSIIHSVFIVKFASLALIEDWRNWLRALFAKALRIVATKFRQWRR